MRGYWNGQALYSRQGNKINPPSWFTQGWPRTPLDGELWSDRDKFQSIISCVKRKNIKENCWKDLRLMVFDLPEHSGSFSQRMTAMKRLITGTESPYLAMVEQTKIDSNKQLYQILDELVKTKGEGLMLHHQDALYRAGRNPQLMKLKKYQDDEAVVIRHLPGKGKYTNQLGALLVEVKSGLRFKIGSGFTDKERKQPPPVGTTITFKYVGKTQRGVPRFASYLRRREKY